MLHVPEVGEVVELTVFVSHVEICELRNSVIFGILFWMIELIFSSMRLFHRSWPPVVSHSLFCMQNPYFWK